MRVACTILAIVIVGGCATTREAPRTSLTLCQYNGATGYGRRIEFDGINLRVVVTSDFEGQPDKLVWQRGLTEAEQVFLSERVQRALDAPLQAEYREPNVWDGLQLEFVLRSRGRAPRRTSVANSFVEELAVVTDALNAVLPMEYRVQYREWKQVTDRFQDETDSPASSETP
jgi:hypothetical protein